jgi:hypothetical protein
MAGNRERKSLGVWVLLSIYVLNYASTAIRDFQVKKHRRLLPTTQIISGIKPDSYRTYATGILFEVCSYDFSP